jgi:hypothetical protein
MKMLSSMISLFKKTIKPHYFFTSIKGHYINSLLSYEKRDDIVNQLIKHRQKHGNKK